MSLVILFTEKSEKIFHDTIMLTILIKMDLCLIKVALAFLSKILLLQCGDFLPKELKNLFLVHC